MKFRSIAAPLAAFLIALAAFPALTAPAIAQEAAAPSGQQPVTCALIPGHDLGFAESAAFQMLTAELSKNPKLALLERAEIDRVLDEKKLQLAFGAEGAGTRRELGLLLKARMLVILRAGEKTVNKTAVRYLDATVAETDAGLRIRRERLVWEDNKPEPAVAQIARCVQEALGQLAIKARQVVAVPPFLCEDFKADAAPMKEAYAEVLRQGLTRAPGIVQVELAEARAIGQELALSGQAALSRPALPYYILGRYRSQGTGEKRTVDMEIQLKQSDQILEQQSRKQMPVPQVSDFLGGATDSFLQRIAKGERIVYNARLESLELLRRAKAFRLLGEWTDSLNLLEASLLIEPTSLEVHRLAALNCAAISKELAEAWRSDGSARMEEQIPQSIEFNLLALDHLEQYFHLGENNTALTAENACELFMNLWISYFTFGDSYGFKKQFDTVGRRRRDIFMYYLERMAPNGKLPSLASPEILRTGVLNGAFMIYAPIDETPEQLLETRYRLIAVFNKAPGLGFYMLDAAWWQWTIRERLDAKNPRHLEIYHQFLDKVGKLPGKKAPFVAGYCKWIDLVSCSGPEFWINESKEEKLKDIDAMMTRMRQLKIDKEDFEFYKRFDDEAKHLRAAIADGKGNPVAGNGEIRFGPLQALISDPEGKPITGGIEGWVPCGPSVDLLWGQVDLFLMKKKGAVEHIYNIFKATEDYCRRITRAVYDGRYVWVAVQRAEPLLLVIDTSVGIVGRFTATDGLPSTGGMERLTPLAPGKVFVACGDSKRSWCAVVAFGTNGRISVDVVHEAKNTSNDPADPGAVFFPEFVKLIHPPSGQPCQVLVGRHIGEKYDTFPLLVNLKDRSVKAISWPYIWADDDTLVEHGDSFYAVEDLGHMLFRITYPGYGREQLIYDLSRNEEGPVVFAGDQCYVLGKFPWKTDRTHRKKISLGGTYPKFTCWTRYTLSSHYGPILYSPYGEFCQVAITPRPFPPDDAATTKTVVSRKP